MTTTNVVQLSSVTPHPSAEYWSVCKVEALFETSRAFQSRRDTVIDVDVD